MQLKFAPIKDVSYLEIHYEPLDSSVAILKKRIVRLYTNNKYQKVLSSNIYN
jgi:hypothetical protein